MQQPATRGTVVRQAMPAHAYASAPAAVHLGGTRAARHPHARVCRAQVTPAVQVEFTSNAAKAKL